MELKELISSIEEKINQKIAEFEALGKQIKITQNKMTLIALELEPVKYVVEKSNPKYIELFDVLINDYKKEFFSKWETKNIFGVEHLTDCSYGTADGPDDYNECCNCDQAWVEFKYPNRKLVAQKLDKLNDHFNFCRYGTKSGPNAGDYEKYCDCRGVAFDW